jgi:ABC-type lipoprotein release transport system permease subunit
VFSSSISILVPLTLAAGLLAVLFCLDDVPLRYNLRNLTVRWKTTLMTSLAFTSVVALLTVMLAFVNGMYRLTESSGHPENVMVLSDGMSDETFSTLSSLEVGDVENQPGVARRDGRPLASRETYLVVNQMLPHAAPGRPQRRFLQLRGIDDPRLAAAVHSVRLYPGGKWFCQAGLQPRPQTEEGSGVRGQNLDAKQAQASDHPTAIQTVLGEGIARELGRDRTPQELAKARNPQRLDVGDTFALGNRTWIVAGVMQSAGSTFDSEVWAKRSIVAPLFGKDVYTTVVLRCQSAAAAEALKTFFVTRYKKAALQANVETEYYAGLQETNQQFLYAIVFVAIVMSIGGIFGVMNTMFAAISQRIKDIGVLRLLGYGRGQILISFLLESLLIALIGGVLGCALGALADGWTANSVVSGSQGGGKFVVLKLAVDNNILAVGLLLSILMGLLGGLLPAVNAMRLRALEALR